MIFMEIIAKLVAVSGIDVDIAQSKKIKLAIMLRQSRGANYKYYIVKENIRNSLKVEGNTNVIYLLKDKETKASLAVFFNGRAIKVDSAAKTAKQSRIDIHFKMKDITRQITQS